MLWRACPCPPRLKIGALSGDSNRVWILLAIEGQKLQVVWKRAPSKACCPRLRTADNRKGSRLPNPGLHRLSLTLFLNAVLCLSLHTQNGTVSHLGYTLKAGREGKGNDGPKHSQTAKTKTETAAGACLNKGSRSVPWSPGAGGSAPSLSAHVPLAQCTGCPMAARRWR